MTSASLARNLVTGTGLAERPRRSRWPAKLDLAQSATGLVLGLFMWGHMFFVSTILISNDAMWTVTRAFEGYFFFGRAFPAIVSMLVAAIFAILVVHTLLAMRKLPGNWTQVRTFVAHRRLLDHGDTTLWWMQAVTGVVLFFLAAVHLYQMLMYPAAIGPYESAARVYHGAWPLYLVLLFAVELHGGIGLYRLALKWGWFNPDDAAAARRRLRTAKWAVTAFFLALGLLTLAAYFRLGHELRHEANPVYTPAWLANPPSAEAPAWWPRGLPSPGH